MAHALGLSHSDMLLRRADLKQPHGFRALIERRLAHEPVAYITGTQGFWDLTLNVTPDVLIPRSDSETLIEAAAEEFRDRALPTTVLDLGTGSGALLLAALSIFPQATGIGIDASAAALDVAQGNGEAIGFGHRTQWLHLSWLEPEWKNGLSLPFDLILCNPPYIEANADLAPMVARHEPHSALFAGTDGLDDYRIILPQIAGMLARKGIAIFEIGHEQTGAVSDLAAQAGLLCHLRHDLAGKPRVLVMEGSG